MTGKPVIYLAEEKKLPSIFWIFQEPLKYPRSESGLLAAPLPHPP
jgi:hypothetical protein